MNAALARKPRVDLEREIDTPFAAGFELGAWQALADVVELRTRPTSVRTPPMRPSRARNRALPRNGRRQRRRCSARREFRGDVHRSRCADGVLRKTRDRRRDGQVLRGARP